MNDGQPFWTRLEIENDSKVLSQMDGQLLDLTHMIIELLRVAALRALAGALGLLDCRPWPL